jgi:glucan 1,3-beta-glucosidase
MLSVENTISSDEKLRGVNLGGWLVLERWMTPSLFKDIDAKDEYSFMSSPNSLDKIELHRKTFITETDFKWIAENSLNAVRIPVGYWILDGDDPYQAGIGYLDWAMNMAEKYGLKVLIDLHAAKGSQNGHDHSGRIGKAMWYQRHDYRENSIDVLDRLAIRYKDSPALWGIELLNEPKLGVLKYLILKNFYRRAYRRLIQAARFGTRIVFSDGFVPWLLSGVLRPARCFQPIMDIHWYQFGRTNLDNYFAHLMTRPDEIARLQRRQPVIIGEWSGMLSHETLEGLTISEKSELQQRHIELQLAAYEAAEGWFYWTYKTEAPGIWNFRWLVEQGQVHLVSPAV